MNASWPNESTPEAPEYTREEDEQMLREADELQRRRWGKQEAPADPILEQLHKLGMEVTRKNYLLLMYGGEATEPLDAEAEALLPAFLRTKQ